LTVTEEDNWYIGIQPTKADGINLDYDKRNGSRDGAGPNTTYIYIKKTFDTAGKHTIAKALYHLGTGYTPGLITIVPITVNVLKVDIEYNGVKEDKEEDPGGLICLNDNDNDGEAGVDKDRPVIRPDSDPEEPMPELAAADPDLRPVKLLIEPLPDTGEVKLTVPAQLQVWTNATKAILIEERSWDLAKPEERDAFKALMKDGVWVEGIATGSDDMTLSYESCEDKVKMNIIKVELDSDLDNDGDIDEDDEPLEEVGLGEVIRVNDTDDIDGNSDGTAEEDDLQYLELKIEPALTEGKVWFTYNTSKVKLWKTIAMGTGDAIPSGSYATPTWDLGAGDTLPAYIFAEGLETTAETDTEESRQIILHWGNGTVEITDTLLTTVTKDLGHYAYFASIPDYIKEKRSPGEPDYKLFEAYVRAPGWVDVFDTHRIVAVMGNESRMAPWDARSAFPQHHKIDHVVASFPSAIIVANGTYFETTAIGTTQGKLVRNHSYLSISGSVSGSPIYNYKGWFGQRDDSTFDSMAPNVEPPLTMKNAVGGLGAFYPLYAGKNINQICNEWDRYTWDSSHFIGAATDSANPENDVMFFITSDKHSIFTAAYDPPINLAAFVNNIVASGATKLFSLDGGASVAIAHQNRLGDDLEVKTKGPRHSWPLVEKQVSNYIVIFEN
jgi:hypothetical protein